jgi:hypothetical protein
MPLDSDSLAQSIARLESSISQAHQYVDDVVVSLCRQCKLCMHYCTLVKQPLHSCLQILLKLG